MAASFAAPDERLAVCNQILACNRFDKVAQSVLAPITQCLGARSAVFAKFVRYGDTMSVSCGTTYGTDPSGLNSFSRHYHRLDPISEAVLKFSRKPTAARDIVSNDDLADSRDIERSDFYNQFLRPLNIRHVMALLIPVRTYTDEVLCIGLHRPNGMTPFSPSEAQLLRQFRPALAAALGNVFLTSAVDSASLAIESLAAESRPVGVAVFDETFTLVFSNHKAIHDLGLGQPDAHLYLGKLLRDAAAAIDAQCTRETVVELVGRGVTALVSKTSSPRQGVRYCITTLESGTHDHMRMQCQKYDLSLREIEVTQMVGAGLSNSGIAEKLNISRRTVENHLRSIYNKVGINSRTQLIAAVNNCH